MCVKDFLSGNDFFDCKDYKLKKFLLNKFNYIGFFHIKNEETNQDDTHWVFLDSPELQVYVQKYYSNERGR